MKNIIKATVAIMAISTFSCDGLKKTGEIQKTKNGSEYILVKDEKGENIKFKDKIIFNFKIYNSKDSLMRSSDEMGVPSTFQVDSNKYIGHINEAFTMASKGDSLTIFEPVDSIFKMYPMARADKGLVAGTKLKYQIKILDVFGEKQDSLFKAAYNVYYEKKMKKDQEEAQMAMAAEPTKIEQYIKASKLAFVKQPEGYYILKTNTTSGQQAKNGDKVKVHYTGKLLDGKKFDSSVDRGEPYELQIGMSQVIQGWHLGLAQLKVGEKATLLLPSNLAYGPNGAGKDIKPFSPLLFDLELLEISK